MRAGRLDRHVQVQVVTEGRSAAGAVTKTWSNLREVWMEKETQRVLARYATDQRLAEADTVWRMRWPRESSMLTVENHRLMYRSTVYDILGVFEIGRREGLHIVTKSRVESAHGNP